MGGGLWPDGGDRSRQRAVDPLRPSVGDRRQGWRYRQDRTGDRRRRLDRPLDRPASALRNQDRRRSGRPAEILARGRPLKRRLTVIVQAFGAKWFETHGVAGVFTMRV